MRLRLAFWRQRAAVALTLMVIALLAWPVATAAAHAVLTRADPAQGAVLASSPADVTLRFVEPPDPTTSRIKVLDAAGHQVGGSSAAQIVVGDPLALQVTLAQPLPQGVYTVSWFTVSALDGHTDAGSYAFGVGVAPPTGGAGGARGGTSKWLSAIAVAGRWLLYVGLALQVGGAAASLLVFAGSPPAGGRTLLRLAWLAAAAGVFILIEQERAATGSASLLPLFQTGEGKLLGYQGLAVLACGAAVIGVELLPRRWTVALLGSVGAAVMLFHVFASHADTGTLRPLNLAAQWVHLLSVAAWIGGLAWLLLGIRAVGPAQRAVSVRRFSRLAGAALAAVVVTGVLRAVSEVGSLHALASTSYGQTLIAKVGLVLVLASLGALNRYRQVPALGRADGPAEAFEWTSRGELALGAGIFALTGLLSGLAPALTGGG